MLRGNILDWTKRLVVLGVIGAVVFAFTTLRGGAQGYEVKALSIAEVEAKGPLVVDIRAPNEWQQTGVIKGAKLVTFNDASSFMAALGDDLNDGRDLVIVCHSGRRSGAAAAALAGTIPNRIISVEGGISRLISEGLQTVAP